MGKKDLTDMLGGGGGRTRQKYRCKADGCQVTPMGVNLEKHYKVNTDWVLLKELKACVGDAALKKKMDQTDPHTRYIFKSDDKVKHLADEQTVLSIDRGYMYTTTKRSKYACKLTSYAEIEF